MKIVEISVKKDMLKINNDEKSSWYKINPSNTEAQAVVNTLAIGDEVDVKSTITNGVSVVSQICKISGLPATPIEEEKTMDVDKSEVKQEEVKVDVIGSVNNFEKVAEDTSKYKCGKCGKAMKDDKYESCYTCNQVEWKSKTSNTDRNTSIEKQAVGKMTARTVAAMVRAGIGVDDVYALIDEVYDKYKEKVIG